MADIRFPKGLRFIPLDLSETEKISAVYILLNDDGLLYIGQSKDVIKRVRSHKRKGVIPFTKGYYLAIHSDLRIEMESVLIWCHKPKFNKAYPPLTKSIEQALSARAA